MHQCSSIADLGLLFDLHIASEDNGRTENLQKQKQKNNNNNKTNLVILMHEHRRTNTGMSCTTHANKHGQRCQSLSN